MSLPAPRRPRRVATTASAVAGIFLLLLPLSACGSDQDKTTDEKQLPVTVTATTTAVSTTTVAVATATVALKTVTTTIPVPTTVTTTVNPSTTTSTATSDAVYRPNRDKKLEREPSDDQVLAWLRHQVGSPEFTELPSKKDWRNHITKAHVFSGFLTVQLNFDKTSGPDREVAEKAVNDLRELILSSDEPWTRELRFISIKAGDGTQIAIGSV